MSLSIFGRKFVSSSHSHVLLVISLLLVVLGSGSAFSANRIVGGADVLEEDAYPWMVSLRDSSSGEHACGGTLIHERWVLSASGCAYGYLPGALTAYIGDYNIAEIEESEQRVDIIERVESGRDLVLFQLAESVDTDLFPVLGIANSVMLEGLSVGDMLTHVGWGDTDARPNVISEIDGSETLFEEFPDTLRESTLPVLSQYDCFVDLGEDDLESVIENYLPILGTAIDSKHICVGYTEEPEEGETGPCDRDLGGPLLTEVNGERFQVGVFSFGPETCGAVGAPNVFTRVSEFKDWIDSIIYAVDFAMDTSAWPSDLATSILREGENPVCRTEEDGPLQYELEDVNTFPIRFLNNNSGSVTVDSVRLIVEEFETSTCGDEPITYTSTEITLADIEGREGCEGLQLATGEACEVDISTNFLTSGLKSAVLEMTLNGGESQVSYDLNFNALGETDFSPSFAENVYFFTEKHNEWQQQGEIVAELISNYVLYEETSLIAKVDGSGVFSFDWKVDGTNIVDLSLWVNGEELTTYEPTQAYGRESIILAEDQVHTIVWRMQKGEGWSGSLPGQDFGNEAWSAYLKAVAFLPDNVEEVNEPEESEVAEPESSGGSSSILFMGFLLVIQALRKGGIVLRRFLGVLGLLWASLFLSSAAAQAENRVIGGDDAEELVYPWMVSLQNKYTGEHYCGGTLIDEFLVMTADHCYGGEPLDSIIAVVGAYRLSESSGYELPENTNAQAIPVTAYIPHETADISWFKLAERATGPFVKLATEVDMRQIGEGDSLRVIGWGDTDPSDAVDEYPDTLQEADVSLSNFETCQENYAQTGEIVSSHMLCAGDTQGGTDTCQGDSGGPLLWENANRDWVQIGVTSFGEGCALADFPGVYTRVASYEEHIEQHIEGANVSLDRTYLGEIDLGSDLYRTVTFTSDEIDPFEIEWVNLGGDGFDMVDGFDVIGDRCTNDILYLNDSCEVDLKASFDTEGVQNTWLYFLFENGDVRGFNLDVRVYSESGLVVEGSGIDFIAESTDSINDRMQLFTPGAQIESGDIWRNGGTGELVVDMSDRLDVSRFGANFSGAGQLSFDWLLSSSEVMNLDVYVDGIRQRTSIVGGSEQELAVTSSYTEVTIELPESGGYVEWVLARKQGAGLGSASGDDAKVAGISFTAAEEIPEEEPVEEVVSSGGAVKLYLLGICLLLLVYRSRKQLHV